jgi:exopolyphosphatase/guanosine-5'-triphosphate,3'-diphosphate pyrophosphatase
LIALPQERGRFRVIDGFSRIVRLGEGLEHSGRLGDEAMDRAVEALKICADKLAQRKIRKQRLIATEACRQALNGKAFLERVKRETGLELEIVNRETEARLAAEGCGTLMDRKSDGAVLFDIGGGSSELILVDSSRNEHGKRRPIQESIVAWTSLPMGVVTLAERFGGKDVTRNLFEDMVQDVMQHIQDFDGREALRAAFKNGRVHLLGTSGTVTTLAGIHLDLPRYDRRRVDGIWLKDTEIDMVINRLIGMSYAERARNPCIGEERADLVLAGCAILNAIRRTWPTPRLRVADRGLREGLLTEMMNADRVWSRKRRERRKKPEYRERQS